MNELEVLKKALPEMVSIMNALPGERFDMKSALSSVPKEITL